MFKKNFGKKLFSRVTIFALLLSQSPLGSILGTVGTVSAANDDDGFIISEYVEGGNTNKAIELYNGSNTNINLSDYKLILYPNGTGTIASLTLSGTLFKGGTFVIVNNSANSSLKSYSNLINSTVINFNGNDALSLTRITDDTHVDVFGKIGVDPGSAWSSGLVTTLDKTLVRKASISVGDSDGSNAFDPSVEWLQYDKDTFDNLGSHTMADVTAPVITLLGTVSVNIANGAVYTDAGATALDNKDGNISENIATTISNNVDAGITFDNTKAATYTYHYNVSDNAGNAASEVTRTVIVAEAVVDPDIALVANAKSAIESATYTNLAIDDLANASLRLAAVQAVVDGVKGTTSAVVSADGANFSVAISLGSVSDTASITTATFVLTEAAAIEAINSAEIDGMEAAIRANAKILGLPLSNYDLLTATGSLTNADSVHTAMVALSGADENTIVSTFNVAVAKASIHVEYTVGEPVEETRFSAGIIVGENQTLYKVELFPRFTDLTTTKASGRTVNTKFTLESTGVVVYYQYTSDGKTLNRLSGDNVGGPYTVGMTAHPLSADNIENTGNFYVLVDNNTALVNFNIELQDAERTGVIYGSYTGNVVPPLHTTNIATVSTVKGLVEGAAYTMAQSAATDEAAVKTAIENKLITLDLDGVTTTVTKVLYTPAVAGVYANPSGTAGTYTFTVGLLKGSAEDTTETLTMTIVATVFDTAAFDLTEAKIDAVTELGNYASADNYREAEKLTLASAIEDGTTGINGALTIEAVGTALADAKLVIDGIKTDAQYIIEETAALSQAKIDAVTELGNYASADNYREAEKLTLASAIEDGTTGINGALTIEAVGTALADAKLVIDGIKTDAQLTAAEAEATLAQAKLDAVSGLNNYADSADYREAEKGELATAKSDGATAINAALDTAGVTSALEAAQGVIDLIKTNAQYIVEETAAITIPETTTFSGGGVTVVLQTGTIITVFSGGSSILLPISELENFVPENIGTIPGGIGVSNSTVQGAIELNFSGSAHFSRPVEIKIPVVGTNPVLIKANHGDGFVFSGLTTNGSATCANGIVVDPNKYAGSPITVSGGLATIYTCSASTFAAYTVTPQTEGNSNGGSYNPTPTCGAEHLVCTNNVRTQKSGVSCNGGDLGKACTLSGAIDTGTIQTGVKLGNIKGSTFTPEFNSAYLYAYSLGITTKPTVQQADMNGNLIRSHMAKMVVNYAMNVMGKKLDTEKACTFPDMENQTDEMKSYSIKACQLGLMGVGTDNFMPEDIVTRAQFGTVMSRMLYDTPESGDTYYLTHLNLLKQKGIIKNDDPTLLEVRAYVMIMFMRGAK